MHKTLVLLVLCLVSCACTQDQLEFPRTPANVELDIDLDGSPDFFVNYSRRVEGDPIGNYEVIRMSLESRLDDNKILKKESELPVFLNDVDLIATDATLPLYWEETNPATNVITRIASIRTDYDGVSWNEEWRVLSSEQKEAYLIGFKLMREDTSRIGFIEFTVDPQTGDFLLLRTEFL